MDSRTAVKLTMGVLAVLAAGMFLAAVIVGTHDQSQFATSTDYGSTTPPSDAIFVAKVGFLCTGGGLVAAIAVLAMYLKQTGPNPPR
jgi:hypothetical protein